MESDLGDTKEAQALVFRSRKAMEVSDIKEKEYVAYAYTDNGEIYRVVSISRVNDNCVIRDIITNKLIDSYIYDLTIAETWQIAKCVANAKALTNPPKGDIIRV